ncbi:MAG: hypothetical protein WC707_04680 [Candidatus Babeliaceae bacterium]|jgi:hypothetical protein
MTKKLKKVASPNQISLLIEAMNCDNENAARLLVKRAMLLSYNSSSHWPKENAWSDDDLDAVVSLMRGIKPQDTVETILAAQFVSLHLKGIETMAQDNYNIMGQAMMMVRLSHQALNMLQQYRGKSQTINVNYNIHSDGDAILNTLIQPGVKEKEKGKT